jgi:hypothetical protein
MASGLLFEHGGTTANKGDIDVAFVGEVGRVFAIV